MDDADEKKAVDRTQTIPPPDDAQAVTSSVDDRTQEVPPAEPAAPMSQEEQDRRLASELRRRGVPPEEIERLLTLGQEPAPAAKSPAKAAAAAAPVIEAEPYEPKPTLTLPVARESTQAERDEADKLLRSAHMEMRRGRYLESEKLACRAVEMVPSDPVALELYGDIMQAVGRVDDAVLCYDRARQAGPARPSAERKYAELRLMQNRSLETLREEHIPRNPYISVVLSAVFPGGGQVYNGEALKGLVIALAALALVMLLGWTNLGFHHGQTGLSMTTVTLIAVAGALYVYALIDANIGANRGRKPKSGWEV